MASIVWDRELAEVYDRTYRAKFEPAVLDPMVGKLAGLARGGPVLEFAVGTGRVALRAPFTSASQSQVAVFEKRP